MGLELATLALLEKRLDLSPREVRQSQVIREMVLPLQSSPKSSTITDKLLEDFSVLGITGMAGDRGTHVRHLRTDLPHQTT